MQIKYKKQNDCKECQEVTELCQEVTFCSQKIAFYRFFNRTRKKVSRNTKLKINFIHKS